MCVIFNRRNKARFSMNNLRVHCLPRNRKYFNYSDIIIFICRLLSRFQYVILLLAKMWKLHSTAQTL